MSEYQYYVVLTQFHGGGIVSRHRTREAAERAARKQRVSGCVCGCAGAISAGDYEMLEDAHNQAWSNPYALTK